MAEFLPDLPEIGVKFPSSPLATEAFAFVDKHSDKAVLHHAVRAAYWALIMAKRLPRFAVVDLDIVAVSCIFHDMGWATTKSLLSTGKRFEVDGANIARDFVQKYETGNGQHKKWNNADVQQMWYAIALHSTASVSWEATPEVALTSMGIVADFYGPNFPNGPSGDNYITLEEYHAVMKRFPRAGFDREGLKKITCTLCREKPSTTYDNWVGGFGRHFGTDTNGEGKEEFIRGWESRQSVALLLPGLEMLEKLDEDNLR